MMRGQATQSTMLGRFLAKSGFCAFMVAVAGLVTVTLVTMTPVSKAETILNNPKAVVELFTSQGCSSCPPADAILHRLSDEGEVITLAFHVDYWNYLGWEDTLSSRESTKRQYAYADADNRRSVYTPQVIVNGGAHVVGSDYGAIKMLISDDPDRENHLPVGVDIVRNGSLLKIMVSSGTGTANIAVAYFKNATMVDVERGENAGRTITYRHAVRDFRIIGTWNGAETSYDLPLATLADRQVDGVAVMVQKAVKEKLPGHIIGAAMYLSD